MTRLDVGVDDDEFARRVSAARRMARERGVHAALGELESLQSMRPDSTDAAIAIARLSRQAGDVARAERSLATALAARPDDELLATELGVTRAGAGDLDAAAHGLQSFLRGAPESPLAWLLLAQVLDDRSQPQAALWARWQALERAHAKGVWASPANTPGHVAGTVRQAVLDVLAHRPAVLRGVLDELRDAHGNAALGRIERAVRAYLREIDAVPPDSMQRPRVLYVPGLPSEPFLDPMLQPWAGRLAAAFPAIRGEAVSLLQEDKVLEGYLEMREGDRVDHYLGGPAPSWDAFFFYRHGQRYDDNHARCPETSAVLESLDLVRIPGQTPEICFSVLAAGTHILPHYGVTNARSVMHLPLLVPADCALHLVDRGTHHWQEGKLVMFDDTFLHEAWNRSGGMRVILLMDCWNPHLTAVERVAITRLSQAIGLLDVALKSSGWADTA